MACLAATQGDSCVANVLLLTISFAINIVFLFLLACSSSKAKSMKSEAGNGATNLQDCKMAHFNWVVEDIARAKRSQWTRGSACVGLLGGLLILPPDTRHDLTSLLLSYADLILILGLYAQYDSLKELTHFRRRKNAIVEAGRSGKDEEMEVLFLLHQSPFGVNFPSESPRLLELSGYIVVFLAWLFVFVILLT